MPDRRTTSLDGQWEFRFGDQPGWRTIAVPGPWQAQFADLRGSHGTGHYRRAIKVPALGHDEVAVLHFGAAAYQAVVRLDGAVLGDHEGSYLPFEVTLPAGTRAATLEVDVTLPAYDSPGTPFGETPHGKQSWYGPTGGLWQSVTLEVRPARHIAACLVRAERRGGTVTASATAAGAATGCTLRLEVRDPAGAVVAQAAGPLDGVTATVTQPRDWSPDSPTLYTAELSLLADGAVLDSVTRTVGFRTIEAHDGYLHLNDAPLYLRGALDQDYYPDGICTPPSTEFLEDQARKAKALGLNTYRCHIKIPDPRYYEVADRLGLLVWTDIPNVEHLTDAAAARLRETFEGALARDGHHPCLVIWSIINEDWGPNLVEDADHRAWLADTYDWAKRLDPDRLVVDNSPCLPNFHVRTDIDDFHYYRSVPERRAEWDRLTEEFAARAPWTFSPHGDAQRTGREPLVVSEFGVWGLPHPDTLAEPDGSEPWWMSTGPGWGDGAAYPHGLRERYDALYLDRVFGSFDRFVEAVQWYQFGNLRYEIETMRRHAPIGGYVITELTDVHWEANGLLDLKRNPRVFHEQLSEVNRDTVVASGLQRWAYRPGEAVETEVCLAAGGRSIPAGCRLRWRLGEASGEAEAPAVAPMVTAPVPLRLAAPDLAEPAMATLQLDLVAPDGAVLATGGAEVAVLPAPALTGTVGSREPAVVEALRALGWTVVAPDEADVTVATLLDAADVERIRLGACTLVLAGDDAGPRTRLRRDEADREPPYLPWTDGQSDSQLGLPAPNHHGFPGLTRVARHGSMWRGDWIASFSWLRREGPFAAIPGGPMLDLAFDGVVPHHVLTGFRPHEFAAHVHAGLVVGWAHKPAATVIELPFGAGRMVATTFRLLGGVPGGNPMAATLLAALVACARG